MASDFGPSPTSDVTLEPEPLELRMKCMRITSKCVSADSNSKAFKEGYEYSLSLSYNQIEDAVIISEIGANLKFYDRVFGKLYPNSGKYVTNTAHGQSFRCRPIVKWVAPGLYKLIFNSEYAKEVFMRDRKNPVEYAEYLQNLIDKWVNCSNLTATTDKTCADLSTEGETFPNVTLQGEVLEDLLRNNQTTSGENLDF